MIKNKTKNNGFTLLEMLLSVAAITIILGISIPLLLSFNARSDLATTSSVVASALRRAQALSRAMAGDDSWGVYIGVSELVVFKGVSYASRDLSSDEKHSLAGSVVPSGISEVVYSKLRGMPSVTGDIVLTSKTNTVNIININGQGTISY